MSNGKDIVALSLDADNLIFSIEGNNFPWALLLHLATTMYLTKAFALPIARYYI